MSHRLCQVPAGCYVLFLLALVAFLASLFAHGTALFGFRQTSIVLLVVCALYRVFRPRMQQGTGPGA